MKKKTNQKAQPKRRSVNFGIDLILLMATFSLVIFGLLMVYSAGWDFSVRLGDSPTYFLNHQLILMVSGIALAFVLSFFDYHYWKHLALPALGITIAALIYTLIKGETYLGAERTLLSGSIQPSELAKLVTIIYLSVWLYSKKDKINEFGYGFVPWSVILGVIGGLIYLQPDFSALLTIGFLGGMLFFLAGADIRQIFLLFVLGIIIGIVVVQINPTGNERIGSYFPGLKDPTQAHYHIRRSIEAFTKGGWFGVGIGKSETKLTGLPVPPTDSIFAVIGEETGVFGSLVVLVLFLIILWRGLNIARHAPDELGALMAGGLSLWIAMEAFFNMAGLVNVLPLPGNALPFISAGGSSLWVSLAAVGILINISRVSSRSKEDDGRQSSAVVDLRRRDRRRRIPSHRRSASA